MLETPFNVMLIAQGPFCSVQDNQEPIYDDNAVKRVSDIAGGRDGNLDNDQMTDKEEHEYDKGNRFRDKLQRHVDAALALAGDYADLKEAIVNAITSASGDLALNLAINTNLDGNSIYKSQKRYIGSEVSIML